METKKFDFINIDKLEKNLTLWLFIKRYRIALFVVVVSLLFVSLTIPYLNLVINAYLVFLVSLISLPFILNIRAKLLIATGIALFFIVFIFWIFGKTDEAGGLTEYIFIILLSGVFKSLFS